MQSNRKCSPRQVVRPQKNQVGINNVHDTSHASAFGGVLPLGPNLSQPMHGVEFQPSETCPRNFIIFDHTEDRSQIMFNPAIAHNFNYPHLGFNDTPIGENSERKFRNNVDIDFPSPFSEDSDDIDALLSSDGDDENLGESEEEEVSTARTHGYDGSSSPDSCSNYAPKARRLECPSSGHKLSFGGSSYNEGKRKKVKKMVKVLRGIVPGGDQMNTVAVLDEAVKYLKSMKGEVQKLGIGNLENIP